MPAGDASYLYNAAGAQSEAGSIIYMGVPHTQNLLLRITAAASTSGAISIKMSDNSDMSSPATPEVGGDVVAVDGSTVLVPFWYSRKYLQATTGSGFTGTGALKIAVVLGRMSDPVAADD